MKKTININSTFNSFIKGVKNGDPDYMLLARDRDDVWTSLFKQSQDRVHSWTFEIQSADSTSGYRTEYTYDIYTPDVDMLKCSLIFRKDGALLCIDKNGVYGFGIPGVTPPAEGVRICICTDKVEFHYEYTNATPRIVTYDLQKEFSECKGEWLCN